MVQAITVSNYVLGVNQLLSAAVTDMSRVCKLLEAKLG